MILVEEAPISITEAIDEHVAALEEPREPDGMYHPSSMWGCKRKVVYELRGTTATNPPDERSKRRFRIGHIMHAFIQEALLSSPELVEFYPEFSVLDKDLRLTGHGDGLCHYVSGDLDIWFVLEAKSARASSFKRGLKDDHAQQGGTYAVQARTKGVWVDDPEAPNGKRFVPPLGEKMVGVLVFYLEKEDMGVKEYWLPYDPAWETMVDERIADLEPFRNDPESLPPRLPLSKRGGKLVKNWQCGYCPFLDLCWKGDPSSVKPTPATEVPQSFVDW